jgi:hypothetical protein
VRLLDCGHVACPTGDHEQSLLVDPMDIGQGTGARFVDVGRATREGVRCRAGCTIDSLTRANPIIGRYSLARVEPRPTNTSPTRESPKTPSFWGPQVVPARPADELDSELRRGSPDPEASTRSAPSQTFIIPTKAFWTNCRYERQGARAGKSGAGWLVRRRAGLRPSTHLWLPTSILTCSQRAAMKRGDDRGVARLVVCLLDSS